MHPQQGHTHLHQDSMQPQHSSILNHHVQGHRQQPYTQASTSDPLATLEGKEHLKAITLRSGKETGEPFIDSTVAPQDTDGVIIGEKVEYKEFFDASDKEVPQIVTHMPNVRPSKLKNEHDKQYQQFLDTLKQLQINIPLVDALVQIPRYGKFMKDLLSKKKKLIDIETIVLTEGASINLMPLSTFKKLGTGHMKSTAVTLQLADRFFAQPERQIKDVLVFLDKYIVSADFIILDCEADKEVPIILGRPFLATGRTLITIYKYDLIEEECNDQSIVLSEEFAVTSDANSLDDCDSIIEANNLELNHGWQIESLDLANRKTPIFKPSIEEALTLELKPLPPHLKYVFMGDHNTLPVIVSATLDVTQEEKLVHILKQHKQAIAWIITNI
ncbi:uncharacterized protein [Gossypium hirsutum]|uniref:Uncharacterized protein n=1 Tax=Gossypium hirsutum TaxID=3635 RepID=A0A1U8JPI8_GOSHI|nr:uncharacterized protein LOC107907828 [Gossypium hirsutum]